MREEQLPDHLPLRKREGTRRNVVEMEMFGGVIVVAETTHHHFAEKGLREVRGLTVPHRRTGALNVGQWTIGRTSVLMDCYGVRSAGQRGIG